MWRSRRPTPMGLSPRVRGNHAMLSLIPYDMGSIPARAGEPHGGEKIIMRWRVYPRACGGTRAAVRQRDRDVGLSPRVRGNPRAALCAAVLSGSIPARAGEPISKAPLPIASGVYPRACGGTASCK